MVIDDLSNAMKQLDVGEGKKPSFLLVNSFVSAMETVLISKEQMMRIARWLASLGRQQFFPKPVKQWLPGERKAI